MILQSSFKPSYMHVSISADSAQHSVGIQFNSALNTWYACCSYQLSLRWRKSWIKPPCEGNKSSIFGDCCAYKKTLYSKSNITGRVVFKSAQSLWFFQPQPAGESRLSSPTTEQRISHLTPTQHSQLHTEGQTTQSTITELSKWTQFTFFLKCLIIIHI